MLQVHLGVRRADYVHLRAGGHVRPSRALEEKEEEEDEEDEEASCRCFFVTVRGEWAGSAVMGGQRRGRTDRHKRASSKQTLFAQSITTALLLPIIIMR